MTDRLTKQQSFHALLLFGDTNKSYGSLKTQLREEYYIDGILCKPEGFAKACSMTNKQFGKNQKKNDIKSHHYILSFDPRAREENGFSAEEAEFVLRTHAHRE